MTRPPSAHESRHSVRGFTTIDLHGVPRAPGHFPGGYPWVKFSRFAAALPRDLSGKSVPDIGCNAGFYSIEMKRRGARRVLGVDFDEHYLAQARFAAEMYEADIEFRRISVYDLALPRERFDILLFMGVLYHLRHPLLALDPIHEHVARDVMIFQPMQRGPASPTSRPIMTSPKRAGRTTMINPHADGQHEGEPHRKTDHGAVDPNNPHVWTPP